MLQMLLNVHVQNLKCFYKNKNHNINIIFTFLSRKSAKQKDFNFYVDNTDITILFCKSPSTY